MEDELTKINEEIEEVDSSQRLLLAVRNLDDFYYMITYLELIGLIKDWEFVDRKDISTFIVDKDVFEHDEKLIFENNKEIKEMFKSLDLFSFELYSLLNMKEGGTNKHIYETQIARKKNIRFDIMKKFKGDYLADIIITYDGSTISDDMIIPCTLDTIYGNKWYKLNTLGGIIDYINLVYWYRVKVHNLIRKIPDDFYLIDINVDLNDNWVFFNRLK